MNKRAIDLEINGKDVSFSVDLASHNAFINGFTATNKVQPSHNFVMTCCADEHKDYVRKLLTGDAGGSLAIQLAGTLDGAYSPQVQVAVKKPSSMQTPLPVTD